MTDDFSLQPGAIRDGREQDEQDQRDLDNTNDDVFGRSHLFEVFGITALICHDFFVGRLFTSVFHH